MWTGGDRVKSEVKVKKCGLGCKGVPVIWGTLTLYFDHFCNRLQLVRMGLSWSVV